ncbi:MAG: ATP-binding cassette domain-containing protein [Pseudomonadota bacterium]
MLKISNITITSHTRTVINDVSLSVARGEIVALLGPNGAGKSELVLGVSGVMPLASGVVTVDDVIVSGMGVPAIRAAGVAAVPEGHQVLSGLSVDDNLRASGPNLPSRALEEQVSKAYEVFPELVRLKAQSAGSLSGGQQQMVAIAQALIARPNYLLIDEMSLGLAPVVIDRLIDVIKTLSAQNIGILLIEQFTHLALDVADRCYVLSQGSLKFDGASRQLKSDRSILDRAYFGQ